LGYCCCCLGFTPSRKAEWVTSIKIRILNTYHPHHYRCVVWPSCHFAQPISREIWRWSCDLELRAILQYFILCAQLHICSQVGTTFVMYRHKAECLFYKWSTRSIWRKFGSPFCFFGNPEVVDDQILSMQGLVI
jgi:hypothetical protein